MEGLPDLELLSEEERNIILNVMRRDEELRHGQESRAGQVKQEIHELRMKGVLRNGDDLSKMCARCKSPFGFLLNTGDVCPVCRFRVCKVCRETTLSSQGWMCTLCFKENQLRWLSNEWLDKEKDPVDDQDTDSVSTHPDSGIGGARDHPASQYSGENDHDAEDTTTQDEEEEEEEQVKERDGEQLEEEDKKKEWNEKQEEEDEKEGQDGKQEKEEEDVMKERSVKSQEEEEEEADNGGDSAYSTAGSVGTSIHTDHGMEDAEVKGDSGSASICAVHDDTAPGSLDARPVMDPMDSLEDVESLSERDVGNDGEGPPGPGSNTTEDVDVNMTVCTSPCHMNNIETVKGETDIEMDHGSDSCGASSGSHEEDISDNKTESSEENESLPNQGCTTPVDEDNATVPSSGKIVPTLEEQIAEVQKMRNPTSNMSYTMQRYFQVDDSGSDTLSIISERTEPEDREDETDRDYTMYDEEDSDSDGTLHDGLDGHWSDDCDDVMDAGATTPRKLSDAEVDEIELQDLQQRHEEYDLQPEPESEPEIPQASEQNQLMLIDADPNEDKIIANSQLVQVSSSPERLSLEDSSVQTDSGFIPQQDDASDPLSQEEDMPSWSISSEDSATQTEEVVFISKEQQELMNQLLMQQGMDKPRLYRSCSEDWTQTDLSPGEEVLQNSELLESKRTSSVSDLESVGVTCEISELVSRDTADEQINEKLDQNTDDCMHGEETVQADSHGDVIDNPSLENLPDTEEDNTDVAAEDTAEMNTADVANSRDAASVSEAVLLDNDEIHANSLNDQNTGSDEHVEKDGKQIGDTANKEDVPEEKSSRASSDPHITEVNGKADNESEVPQREIRTPTPDLLPQQEEDQPGLQSADFTHPAKASSTDYVPETHDADMERQTLSTEEEFRSSSPDYLPEADVDLDDLPLTDTFLAVSDSTPNGHAMNGHAIAGEGEAMSVEDELSSQASGGHLSTTGSAEGGASYSSASTLLATAVVEAHESEIQQMSTPDQSRRFAMDHMDGSDQSDVTSSLSYAHRSSSTGNLLRDDDHVSKSPSMSKAFTGSVDQLNRNDNVDGAIGKYRKRNKLSRSKFSLAASRESLASVYSDAGEINYGRIPVSGEITFGLAYDQKQSALRIHIKGCQDLAPVDIKHNRSDPYVKVYLLPDKTRSGKRKSKIKKHTLNPVYNETLSYTISPGELETRTLWVTVWHSDRFGRNDFLGEVNLPMDVELFDDTAPRTYTLESRMMSDGVSEVAQQYKGDLILSLMYVTADKVMAAKEGAGKKSKSKLKKSKSAAAAPLGQVHAMVKSAKHLTAVRSSGASDPFAKGYLLPERGRGGKQKTPVVKNSVNPMWNHILVFEGVDDTDLADRCLELTVWDHEKLGTNQFLGGVRLNLGLGVAKEQQVEWMDGRGEESAVWQSMMERPNTWIDALIPLRASMGRAAARK